MRKMNRIAALLAAAILTLSLTACGGGGGNGQTGGKDPLVAAQENMNAAASMDAVMTMNMELEMGGETVKTVTSMDMTMFTEPMRMRVEASTEAAGQSAVISIYAEEADDGGYMMYMNDGTNWYSTAATAEDLSQYEVSQSMSAYIDSASSFKQEGTETVDGVSAYKYTGVITGQNMQDVIKESGSLNSLSSLGLSEDQLEEMLSGLGDIPVTLWISEADLYPVRYDMDMTAVMDGLMKAVLESLGDQAQGLTMSVPEMSITMTCSNFNSATDFTIPEEAKN
ncbi:MAG: hypothetical protein K2O45_11300 [Oscillospiraceae bacterium]|nr:hypothetical protein [Oscillospiraceae bacterium]